MAKVAVFASGRGSNFAAIYEHLRKQSLHHIACLVTDHALCGAADFARVHDIPVLAAEYAKGVPREVTEKELLPELLSFRPDLVVLAGYMRLLGPVLLNAFPERIINIHPSLLPKFPGAHAIKESYEAREEYFGITIHYVDPGMDTGPIIVQNSLKRKAEESFEEFETRIHRLEHETYPDLILTLLEKITIQSPGRSL